MQYLIFPKQISEAGKVTMNDFEMSKPLTVRESSSDSIAIIDKEVDDEEVNLEVNSSTGLNTSIVALDLNESIILSSLNASIPSRLPQTKLESRDAIETLYTILKNI